MRLLLKAGVDPNAVTTRGLETPYAVMVSQEPVKRGKSVLALAAQLGHAAVVEALLAAGARVDYNNGGPPPLYLAAKAGFAAVLELLIDAGAQLDGLDERSGKRPLHVALKLNAKMLTNKISSSRMTNAIVNI